MTTEELVQSVLAALNDQQADYMLVGSLATNFYCVPRATQDVDIVVQSSLLSVARTLSTQVPSLRLDPQLQFESVTATKKALLRAEESNFDIEHWCVHHGTRELLDRLRQECEQL